MLKRCVVCGAEYNTTSKKRYYCSLYCKLQVENPLMKKKKKTCLNCGKDFETNGLGNYCSIKCRKDSRAFINNPEFREYLFEKFNFKCVECGEEGRDLHHIIPLWQNGMDEENNIELLCADCHKKKHRICA